MRPAAVCTLQLRLFVENLQMVIIIANKMLQPLHIIMPLMLITMLLINNSLSNYGQQQ